MSDSATTEPTTRPKTTVEKESIFRGTWQPTIYKPVFGAYQFLPTPPPQEPRKKDAVEVKEEASPRKKTRDSQDLTQRQRLTGKLSNFVGLFMLTFISRSAGQHRRIVQDHRSRKGIPCLHCSRWNLLQQYGRHYWIYQL